ncbi:hypothetical protein SDC9_47867 [bioreactor metagenome]|uniref:Uncharacterized protein n=1 Tax=bioreactor metagenome TaxID=1076179 RepID=A0A644WDM8_9ZZZZ
MATVIEISHLGLQTSELPALLLAFNDLQILERYDAVVDIMDGEEGARDRSQLLSDPSHCMDQAQTRSNECSSIAIPDFAAVLSLAVSIDDVCVEGRDEQSNSSGEVLPPIGENPLLHTVVDNRGCDGHQLVRLFVRIAVELAEFECHHASHAGAQHIERVILGPQVLIAAAEISKPLGEGGILKILGVGSESGHQRCVHIKSCIEQALCAVAVHRRGGGKSMNQENRRVAALCVGYALCLLAEHLRFIGCKHVCLFVLISDEGGVPENE